ncbi:hypothetical protein ppKF707_4884 [Metapseudomonas furukawaii]|uniref:Uncharacterized protein n=1 Tax=Metapseudomonas furukawaii TaxID=1149133 RepID=A0AAD1C1Z2_METFU|nr:hypothetical protein ppKF707_4884 [Pseudomonas furukawaii]BAU75320.1 hypothetical protein KF707C_36320 [Pseudomonas furukawaii]
MNWGCWDALPDRFPGKSAGADSTTGTGRGCKHGKGNFRLCRRIGQAPQSTTRSRMPTGALQGVKPDASVFPTLDAGATNCARSARQSGYGGPITEWKDVFLTLESKIY